MVAIHQFVPSLASRDAIGHHTLQVQRVLHDMGIESAIYASEAQPEVRRRCSAYRTFGRDHTSARDRFSAMARRQPSTWFGSARSGGAMADRARTWLMYQGSTGSPVAGFVMARPEPKLLDYHNITPDLFFAPWEPHVAAELALGRRQLAELAPVTELALADSAFNEAELTVLGFGATAVLPIIIDTDDFDVEPDPATLRRLERERDRGGADWLFVGRISPHKAQHELVKALALYRRNHDPLARLHLVGGSSSHSYLSALEAFVADLGLTGAVDIVGSVPPAVLCAHYLSADVLTSASRHEGFGVPLVEAMHHGVPIVAVDAAAVPETLGRGTARGAAGLLVGAEQPALFAAAVARVIGDAPLQTAMVERGRERAADFAPTRTSALLRTLVERLVADAPT